MQLGGSIDVDNGEMYAMMADYPDQFCDSASRNCQLQRMIVECFYDRVIKGES